MGGESKVVITRLEPVHDPEAYRRVIHTLGIGLRRALSKLCRDDGVATQRQDAELPGRV